MICNILFLLSGNDTNIKYDDFELVAISSHVTYEKHMIYLVILRIFKYGTLYLTRRRIF